jgi:hypothetical protein
VVATFERISDFFASGEGTERQAVGDALRLGHDVGHDVEVIRSPHLAGTAVAGLDLVDDQESVALVGNLLNPGEPAVWRDDDTPLTHHRLDDNGRQVVGGVCR